MNTLSAFSPIALPAFADNYIWVLPTDQGAVVVDPGDAAPVLAHLEKTGTKLAAILLTHHHDDHIGGVAELLRHQRVSVPVHGPADGRMVAVDRPLKDGDTAAIGGVDWQVLGVPGHTLTHLAYYHRGLLFCGDTLFGAGCGRLFEGAPAQMHASLMKLSALPVDTRVYCAHEYTEANLRFAAAVEPDNEEIEARIRQTRALRARGEPSVPSTLALELATNPFLRCHTPAVAAAARQRLGVPAADECAVFAAIRAWKNEFR